MNSTLGSVVPLAMFHFPSHIERAPLRSSVEKYQVLLFLKFWHESNVCGHFRADLWDTLFDVMTSSERWRGDMLEKHIRQSTLPVSLLSKAVKCRSRHDMTLAMFYSLQQVLVRNDGSRIKLNKLKEKDCLLPMIKSLESKKKVSLLQTYISTSVQLFDIHEYQVYRVNQMITSLDDLRQAACWQRNLTSLYATRTDQHISSFMYIYAKNIDLLH